MSLWNFGLNRMMAIAGQDCKIVIDNEPIFFSGILDQVSNLVQDDRGIEWVENLFRLTVLYNIAAKIPKDKMNVVQIDDQTYTVRHILLTGDGANSELYLTKVAAFNDECDPPGSC